MALFCVVSRGVCKTNYIMKAAVILTHPSGKMFSPSLQNTKCHVHRRTLSTKNQDSEDIACTRNIGIIAHIDAGKTTTTERMLFYSGCSKYLGDVDRGDTITDFMEQERERGISITSAAVTFHWKHHKVNLIDTPGHVDFTVEVERALRVLDGAVVVLDSSAGVQAQTVTVWRQANRYSIPCLVYLNKMDKPWASLDRSLNSLRSKLRLTPLLLQLPVGEGKEFSGVLDLLRLTLLQWSAPQSQGSTFTATPLTADHPLYPRAAAARASLIGQLADHDDHIADLVLGEVELEVISASDLQSAVRRATLSRKVVPVLCGSSLKNVGVQPLLDAVLHFLPSPKDINYGFADYYGTHLCALAFKVSHFKHRGPLTFVRIYSGSLDSGSSVYNINRSHTEKASRVLQVYADSLSEISRAVAGNIVAVSGLKQTVTGDTLTSGQSAVKAATRALQQHQGGSIRDGEEAPSPILAGVPVPPPVFFCSVEPPSLAFQKDLDDALQCLQKEDPSLKVEVNGETGQTVLCGMGELHLDIVHSRILQEYGVQADMGPLQIAYRETITQPASGTEVLDKRIGESRHHVSVRMSVEPDAKCAEFRHVHIDAPHDSPAHHIKRHRLQALENGIKSALANGPILGFPVMNVSVALQELQVGPGTSLAMVAACGLQCVTRLLQQALPALLEPLMELQISLGGDHLQEVTGDLQRRGCSQWEVQAAADGLQQVAALAPLAELRGYSTALRTLTSGTADFSMQLAHYQQMEARKQAQVLQEFTGLPPSV